MSNTEDRNDETLDSVFDDEDVSAEDTGVNAEVDDDFDYLKEIEEIEYRKARLDTESIDDIFANVEDINKIPIVSVDSKEDKNKKE